MNALSKKSHSGQERFALRKRIDETECDFFVIVCLSRKEYLEQMEQEPLISAIIPTYNREHTIERAVNSVLNQSYSNLEVIVVDDGSTDQTEKIVRKIPDERVTFYKMSQNGGAGHARNEGVKLAKGEIIAFHDSDDVWRPEKLQRQMMYWKIHPEISMVYCAYICHFTDGNIKRMPEEYTDDLEGDIFVPLLRRNTIGAPTILVKKSAFWECGGFDENFRSLEDWEFALRFAKKNKIGLVKEVLIDVYMGLDGISSSMGAYFDSRCKMIAMYKNVLIETNTFEIVVQEVLLRAKNYDVFESVSKMFMFMLQ